jgi:hypothetical protein
VTRHFVSPANTFIFEYPDDWKLVWEDKNTIMLFKKGGIFHKESDNSLRISPMVLNKDITPGSVAQMANDLKEEHADLKMSEDSGYYYFRYKNEETEGGIPIIQDHWQIAVNNKIFICTFTTLMRKANSHRAMEEQKIAEKIIRSIKKVT